MFLNNLANALTQTGAVYLVYVLAATYFIYHLPFVQARKVQPQAPAHESPGYQLKWSLLYILTTSLLWAGMLQLARAGYTQIYLSLSDYPLWYFFVSIALYLILFDSYFYVIHRLLHTKWLYRHVHSVHHRVKSPSALTPYCLHPFEAALYAAFSLALLCFMPMHLAAFFTANLILQALNFCAHFGYELFPRGFVRRFPLISTCVFHDLHHQIGQHNFSYFTTWLDRYFGTLKHDYPQVFAQVTGEASISPASAAGAMPDNAQKKESIWLHSRAFDLIFFHLSALGMLILLIPYYIWGHSIIYAVYAVQSLLGGIPHTYLTGLILRSSEARRHLRLSAMWTVSGISLVSALLIWFYRERPISDLIMSFIFYMAAWHSYRQNHGISKIYDYVIAQRTGDETLKNDMKPLYWFYGLAINTVIIASFTLPEIKYQLRPGWMTYLIYPHIPPVVLRGYLLLTLAVGLWAFKRTVLDRLKNNRPLPVPQLTLTGVSLVAFFIPYLLLPLSDYILLWMLPTLAHNIQYFAFVWLFEKKRAELNVAAAVPLEGLTRFAAGRSWVRFYIIPLALALITVAAGSWIPDGPFIAFIQFWVLFHYLGDAVIWKRSFNSAVSPVSRALV